MIHLKGSVAKIILTSRINCESKRNTSTRKTMAKLMSSIPPMALTLSRELLHPSIMDLKMSKIYANQTKGLSSQQNLYIILHCLIVALLCSYNGYEVLCMIQCLHQATRVNGVLIFTGKRYMHIHMVFLG